MWHDDGAWIAVGVSALFVVVGLLMHCICVDDFAACGNPILLLAPLAAAPSPLPLLLASASASITVSVATCTTTIPSTCTPAAAQLGGYPVC